MVQERKLDEETTLEKDVSVTDWQLNDTISFQKETILIRLSLIVQYFDFFFGKLEFRSRLYYKNRVNSTRGQNR